MKQIRRLSALFLAIVMFVGAFGISIPEVLAAPIVNESETGSITIHKRVVGSMKNWLEAADENTGDLLFGPGDGTELDDDHQALEESEPLADILFTITKVVVKAAEDPDADTDIVINGVRYVVDTDAPYYDEGTTDSDGIVVFEDLPLGYYLVQEPKQDGVYKAVDDFIVELPFTDPASGSTLLYDIHVYPKNQTYRQPGCWAWVTEVENLYDSYLVYGETAPTQPYIPWIMEGEIPADVGTSNHYDFILTDIKDTPLLFDNSGAGYRVYVQDENGDPILDENDDPIEFRGAVATDDLTCDYNIYLYDDQGNTTNPNADAGYYTIVTAADISNYDIDAIEIEFNTNGLKKLTKVFEYWEEAGLLEAVDEDGEEIIVYPRLYLEFSSWYEWWWSRDDFDEIGLEETDKLISDYVAQPLHPEFHLRYGNMAVTGKLGDRGDYLTTVDEVPYVYYGGFPVYKYDGETDEPLEGAEFKLYYQEDDYWDGIDPIDDILQQTDWVITSQADGYAWFWGVPFGGKGISLDAADAAEAFATYWLVETQAPVNDAGKYYNLLGEPKEITVNATSHLEENQIDVPNYMGVTLPETGGIGTLIFIVAGCAVVLAALFILFANRRRSAGF